MTAADAAVAAAAAGETAKPARRARLPLLLGFALALAGGAGGFLAARGGWIGGDGAPASGDSHAPAHAEAPAPAAFVPLPPIVVNLPGAGPGRFLRFAGQVETAPADAAAVAELAPRIVDVLNGYLRAISPEELSAPDALLRLRSQMLRRVQVVAGGTRARDLLVMEFVLN
jgi:flagellar FliL protein